MTSNSFTIGRASKETGCNIETIRYYEKIGLIEKPNRSPGGNRIYSPAQVRALTFIKRARSLGLGLKEVRALLELSNESDKNCDSAKEIADEHLMAVRDRLAHLRRLETVLSNLSVACANSPGDGCPILEALTGNTSIEIE